MNPMNKALSGIAALVLLSVFGFVGYAALTLVTGLLTGADFQLVAVTGVASLVTLVGAMSISSSIRWAAQQNKVNQFHAEKAATYQHLIEVWEMLLWRRRGTGDQTAPKLSEALRAADRLLLLYGGTVVVKTHATLRRSAREIGCQNSDVLPRFAQLLVEIRKDLGLDVRGLSTEDLLELLCSDAEEANDLTSNTSQQDYSPRVSLAANA